MDLRSLIPGAAAILLSAAPAAAHAGFLVPVLDASDTSGEVILNASFSDDFPDPDIALHAQDWTIVGPSGERFAFDDIGANGTLTALRVNLESEGTYRLSSGERLGRTGKVARIDGELMRLGGDGMARADLPDGTDILTSQTATVSDIYITRQSATPEVLRSRIGRLAIVPLSDPTAFAPGGAVRFAVRFDGEAMAGQSVSAFVPGGSREEGVPSTTLLTDAMGVSSLACKSEGAHLLMVRHLAAAPEGALTDVRSYSTTLTLICA
jgi:hypothetical protein